MDKINTFLKKLLFDTKYLKKKISDTFQKTDSIYVYIHMSFIDIDIKCINILIVGETFHYIVIAVKEKMC